jgi:hypothetical protein
MDVKFSFGKALELLKAGKRVAREGWNGKGQWVSCTQGRNVPIGELWSEANKDYLKLIGKDTLEIKPYLSIYTTQGNLQPGWVPSSADLFAEDWVEVQ